MNKKFMKTIKKIFLMSLVLIMALPLNVFAATAAPKQPVLSFSTTEYNVRVGSKVVPKVKAKNITKSYTTSSSNPDVAEYVVKYATNSKGAANNKLIGIVTKNPGTATITLSALGKDGSTVSADLIVNVLSGDGYIKEDSVSIDYPSNKKDKSKYVNVSLLGNSSDKVSYILADSNNAITASKQAKNAATIKAVKPSKKNGYNGSIKITSKYDAKNTSKTNHLYLNVIATENYISNYKYKTRKVVLDSVEINIGKEEKPTEDIVPEPDPDYGFIIIDGNNKEVTSSIDTVINSPVNLTIKNNQELNQTYSASSSNSSIVTASISGKTITVNPVKVGNATITVKSSFGPSKTFAVNVKDNTVVSSSEFYIEEINKDDIMVKNKVTINFSSNEAYKYSDFDVKDKDVLGLDDVRFKNPSSKHYSLEFKPTKNGSLTITVYVKDKPDSKFNYEIPCVHEMVNTEESIGKCTIRKYKKCASCPKADYTNLTEIKNHDFSGIVIKDGEILNRLDSGCFCDKNAKCIKICSVCGDEASGGGSVFTLTASDYNTIERELINTDIASHEHLFNEDPATCKKYGTKEYECTLCTCNECKKFYKPVKVPPLVHTEEVVDENDDNNIIKPAKEPTCTSDGRTEEISCKECGFIFKPSETIPATGHNKCTVTYTWDKGLNDENNNPVWYCTAKKKCINCDTLINNKQVKAISSENRIGDTCTYTLRTLYTATFPNDPDFETKTRYDDTIITKHKYEVTVGNAEKTYTYYINASSITSDNILGWLAANVDIAELATPDNDVKIGEYEYHDIVASAECSYCHDIPDELDEATILHGFKAYSTYGVPLRYGYYPSECKCKKCYAPANDGYPNLDESYSNDAFDILFNDWKNRSFDNKFVQVTREEHLMEYARLRALECSYKYSHERPDGSMAHEKYAGEECIDNSLANAKCNLVGNGYNDVGWCYHEGHKEAMGKCQKYYGYATFAKLNLNNLHYNNYSAFDDAPSGALIPAQPLDSAYGNWLNRNSMLKSAPAMLSNDTSYDVEEDTEPVVEKSIEEEITEDVSEEEVIPEEIVNVIDEDTEELSDNIDCAEVVE